MRRTTKQHKKWWAGRKIDWRKHYTDTWDHPHRGLIVKVLQTFPWKSLWEIGCASGPNLIKIAKEMPSRELGGNDINPGAIQAAKALFKNAMFEVSSSDDTLLSDKACDVVLSDMHLIYFGPLHIRNALKEIRRIARNRVILVEFDSKSWWRRLWLRIISGYHAYDYQRLLESCGFYDIMRYKIPAKYYPNADSVQKEFITIISAKP